jgi:hypothetical protein
MGINAALAGGGSHAGDRPNTVPWMIYFYRIVSGALIRGAAREQDKRAGARASTLIRD